VVFQPAGQQSVVPEMTNHTFGTVTIFYKYKSVVFGDLTVELNYKREN